MLSAQQEAAFHKGLGLWFSSTKRHCLVSSALMGLSVGDSMFLEQHLLYDNIINEKTTHNQRLIDTFQKC